jgi:hypothetical protein
VAAGIAKGIDRPADVCERDRQAIDLGVAQAARRQISQRRDTSGFFPSFED